MSSVRPGDEGRRPQRPQLRFDRSRVLVVESLDEALQIAGALFGPHQGSQIGLDILVCDDFGPLVAGPSAPGERKIALSASMAFSVSRRPPALTISTNGLNASAANYRECRSW